jgi:hypothetical protein
MKTETPVIQLLDMVWENTNKAVGHSWERLNHAMQEALSLTIGAGFEFAEEDMAAIASKYNFGYWCGESPEWIYGAAVDATNLSAAKSYEKWKNREPFIADNVKREGFRGGYRHGGHSERQRERLAVGAIFPWKGYTVKVTSFAKDGKSFTACSYLRTKDEEFSQRMGWDSYEEKLERRFRITREDIIADRAERKERDDLVNSLTQVAKTNGNSQEILLALSVKTKDELARVSLTKLRKVANRFAEATR